MSGDFSNFLGAQEIILLNFGIGGKGKGGTFSKNSPPPPLLPLPLLMGGRWHIRIFYLVLVTVNDLCCLTFITPILLDIFVFLPSKVHAAFPRLVLHLYDDEISVRQACRVFSCNPSCFFSMKPSGDSLILSLSLLTECP